MELIADVVAFLQSLVPLEGARVAELGCGKADCARALIARWIRSSHSGWAAPGTSTCPPRPSTAW